MSEGENKLELMEKEILKRIMPGVEEEIAEGIVKSYISTSVSQPTYLKAYGKNDTLLYHLRTFRLWQDIDIEYLEQDEEDKIVEELEQIVPIPGREATASYRCGSCGHIRSDPNFYSGILTDLCSSCIVDFCSLRQNIYRQLAAPYHRSRDIEILVNHWLTKNQDLYREIEFNESPSLKLEERTVFVGR